MQNKFKVHIYQFSQNGYQLAQNRSDATLATLTLFGYNLVIFHPIFSFFFLNACFFKDKSQGCTPPPNAAAPVKFAPPPRRVLSCQCENLKSKILAQIKFLNF